jgi:DNA-binding IclR family transcriptional regulator
MPRAEQLERNKADYAVHSVENALDLLDAICDEGGEARVTQLSQRLGMSKASVFRLLATFENRGFVERSEDSLHYRLGLSACEMGQKILARMGVLRKARPTMDRLARQCTESVYYVVRRNDYLLMLDMVDSVHQVKIVPLVGQRFPLATTAAGRIFLAFDGDGGDSGRKRNDAPGAAAMTPLEREAVRNCGFCIDEHGFGEGVTCLAVPLFNGKGQVAAALAILGPSYRMTGARIDDEMLSPLHEAGGAISAGLGYLGGYPRGNSVS